MTYISKLYKNGLVNIPKVLRERFKGGYIAIEDEGDVITLKPIDSKPKYQFEDENGIITEYENGDFDVEFKKGLDLKTFKEVISNLKE